MVENPTIEVPEVPKDGKIPAPLPDNMGVSLTVRGTELQIGVVGTNSANDVLRLLAMATLEILWQGATKPASGIVTGGVVPPLVRQGR